LSFYSHNETSLAMSGVAFSVAPTFQLSGTDTGHHFSAALTVNPQLDMGPLFLTQANPILPIHVQPSVRTFIVGLACIAVRAYNE